MKNSSKPIFNFGGASGQKIEYPKGMIIAAKLRIKYPDWRISRIAEATGISRTTMYNWIQDQRFLELIENLSQSPDAGVHSDKAIEEMDDSELDLFEKALEKEVSVSGTVELSSLMERLIKRIQRLDQKLWPNAMAEVKKVAVRIARLDPGREIDGFDQLGNPLQTDVEALRQGAEIAESVATAAKIVWPLLTDEQQERVHLYSGLSRWLVLEAALLRHGLSGPERR